MPRLPQSISLAPLILAGSLCLVAFAADASEMAKDFVYLRDVDPTIQQDMRYASANNFTGSKVTGYEAPECVLVRQAAQALKRVQADLNTKGLSLRVYDCYRPARSVAAFVAWAKRQDDARAKAHYYPRLDKTALFSRLHCHTIRTFAGRHDRCDPRHAQHTG